MNIFAVCVTVRNRSLLVTPLLLVALAASVHADPLFLAPFLSFDAGDRSQSVAMGDLNGLGNGDGTLRPKSDYGTGSYPVSVAIGDVNGDGKPDLAVANNISNTVSVLLQNGDGTFGPRSDYGTGSTPFSVVIGDLNGDGKPDLAVAGGGTQVSVLLGNGDGTFGPKSDYWRGSYSTSVAIGDLNGDGKLDLALASNSTYTVAVLLGNGDGTFGPRSDYGTGSDPLSVAIGDVNGDGKPDLALANSGIVFGHADGVSVLLGNGDGTFGPKSDYETGSFPQSVAIGDLNGDGKPDLAVANAGPNSVSVLVGNGDGTFGLKSDYGTGIAPTSVAIGDVNGDGKPDLVVVNAGSNTVSVLLTCPTTPMSFDLTPNTLNLRSMGHWITATLEPDPPAAPADIDISSIRLNHSVQVDPSAPTSIGDVDGDGRPDLTVKFSRMAVELIVPEGDAVPVTVSGTIGSGCFDETELIRVIRVPVTAPAAGSALQSGSAAEVRWETPAGIQVQSVAVLFSSDDGSTWNLVARELPNTGSHLWTVPPAATDQARIAVVLVESADLGGDEVVGVLGVSGRFAISAPLAVGGASMGFSLHGPVPNPSRSLSLSFTLPDAKPARLVVYDVSGREVSRREVGNLGMGRHVVALSARRELAPGVYLVHLIQGNRRLVARAVVIR